MVEDLVDQFWWEAHPPAWKSDTESTKNWIYKDVREFAV